ncbi:hypothetical protein PSJE_04180 [Pseudomonas jessenii]|nr:hypothetical protein PSJE_04180 [Pseudomonas jessenii]
MARGLAPVGLRSGPRRSFRHTLHAGFTTAAPPNGGKPPRHRGESGSRASLCCLSPDTAPVSPPGAV